MRPTLQDIADKTGADRGTVSRVLRGRGRDFQIGPERERRILAVARQLGYRRNSAGRSLASGRFHQIGVLAPSAAVLFRAYHEGVLCGVWNAAAEAGYRVVIDAAKSSAPIAFFEEHFVDGVIILGPVRSLFTRALRLQLKKAGPPIVTVGGGGWMSEFVTVDINDVEVGRQAAACLIEHGHRNIAILGGFDDHDTARLRTRGFLDEMKRLGADPASVSILRNGYAQSEAYPDALRLLQDGQVTAVFCLNDNVALAVFAAARELGVRVPEDVSVVGVDAIEAGRHTTPPVTTFRQPLVDIGREAFALLMMNPKRPVHRIFEAEFVAGGSVGPCRRHSSVSPRREGE